MEDHKKEWIDKVLASAKNQEIPAVNPFLLTRIEGEISTHKNTFSYGQQIRWTVAASILLVINIGVVLFTVSQNAAQEERSESYEQLSESYFGSDSTETSFYANIERLK